MCKNCITQLDAQSINSTMTDSFPPATCKAWQYSSTKGGLEKNLKINPSTPLPKPNQDQHLVQVIAMALNPVDYKVVEIPFIGRLLRSNPATPGLDFAGRIVTPAANTSFERGQLVFGAAGVTPFAGGALSEFALVKKDALTLLPDGLDAVDAATIGIAGMTSYQSIVPNVKKGDRIFINGGSGGVGVFGIQIAKAVGCHVTTTCSTVSVEMCKSLGADEVVDYKKQSVLEGLKAIGQRFDLVVDNVGSDTTLYSRGPEYMKPEAMYLGVGAEPSLGTFVETAKRSLLGKQKYSGLFAKPKADDFAQIGTWMVEGKVKPVIDSKFSFEQAPQAFDKLKTKRAKGKIVIDVATET